MPLLLLLLASIHTMMQDMIRVKRMGIMMVSKIYEAILTMMASLIVTVIQRRKNSGFI